MCGQEEEDGYTDRDSLERSPNDNRKGVPHAEAAFTLKMDTRTLSARESVSFDVFLLLSTLGPHIDIRCGAVHLRLGNNAIGSEA